MKNLGVIRKVDSLGRIVLPKPFREELGWVEETPLELFSDGENVTIRKYIKSCVLCGNAENLTFFDNKPICEGCLTRLRK